MNQGLASERSGVRRVGCSAHCAACGYHFSSDGAFDAHRGGRFDTERYCLEPEDERDRKGKPVFVARTTDGVCRIMRGVHEGVTVWTLRANMEDVERLAAMRQAA